MRAPLRIAAFAAALGVAFGAAALAGGAIDPLRDPEEPAGHEEPAEGGHGAEASHGATAAAAGGLAVAEGGYALVPERSVLPEDGPAEIGFRILGPDGAAVRRFEVEHERPMHLILVRRDLSAYRHLHPRMDGSGRWSVRVDGLEPGVHRAYADFHAGGASRTLAVDLHVAGDYRPQALPAPAADAETAGYRVAIHTHGASAGTPAEVEYAVTRGGRPVADLEPYLGADGHLVALREGDLAFLHVHPEDGAGAGLIRFAATFPSAGRYRLFLQFRHDGVVRTVAHTVEVAR